MRGFQKSVRPMNSSASIGSILGYRSLSSWSSFPFPVTIVQWYCFETAPLDADRFALLLELEMIGGFARLLETLTTDGLIVIKPIIYRDGVVHTNWVGQPEQIRAALGSLPAGFVTVEGISDFDVRREAPTAALTDRQFEAVQVASGLGYHESPREATHAEIAPVLGCSPSTATVHIQKAEAKLVTGVLASSPDSR